MLKFPLKSVDLAFPPHLFPLLNPYCMRADQMQWRSGQLHPLPYTKFQLSQYLGYSDKAHSPIVHWHNLVWFPKSIPRHCFILWIAIQESLSLAGCSNFLCFFFLFDSYKMKAYLIYLLNAISQAICKQVCLLCSMSKPQHSVCNEVNWLIGKLGGKSIRKLSKTLLA